MQISIGSNGGVIFYFNQFENEVSGTIAEGVDVAFSVFIGVCYSNSLFVVVVGRDGCCE